MSSDSKRPTVIAALPVERERISSWELYPGELPYAEHRTVTAILPVERVGSWEIRSGARQRRVEMLVRETHEQDKKPQGASFAQVLENKQKPPSP